MKRLRPRSRYFHNPTPQQIAATKHINELAARFNVLKIGLAETLRPTSNHWDLLGPDEILRLEPVIKEVLDTARMIQTLESDLNASYARKRKARSTK